MADHQTEMHNCLDADDKAGNIPIKYFIVEPEHFHSGANGRKYRQDAYQYRTRLDAEAATTAICTRGH